VYARTKIDGKIMSKEATYEKLLAKYWRRVHGATHYSIFVKENLGLLDTWTAEKEGFKGKDPDKFRAAFDQEKSKHGCMAPLLALLKKITGNDNLDFA